MKSRLAAERTQIFLKVELLISASQCSVARDAGPSKSCTHSTQLDARCNLGVARL
jgi:hypothetical protein